MKKSVPQKSPIDKDILALDLDELRQLYMQSRTEARQGLITFFDQNNDGCWDELIIAAQNLLPKNERKIKRRKKFLITEREFLFNCTKYASCLAAKNIFPPEKPYCLE